MLGFIFDDCWVCGILMVGDVFLCILLVVFVCIYGFISMGRFFKVWWVVFEKKFVGFVVECVGF